MVFQNKQQQKDYHRILCHIGSTVFSTIPDTEEKILQPLYARFKKNKIAFHLVQERMDEKNSAYIDANTVDDTIKNLELKTPLFTAALGSIAFVTTFAAKGCLTPENLNLIAPGALTVSNLAYFFCDQTLQFFHPNNNAAFKKAQREMQDSERQMDEYYPDYFPTNAAYYAMKENDPSFLDDTPEAVFFAEKILMDYFTRKRKNNSLEI